MEILDPNEPEMVDEAVPVLSPLQLARFAKRVNQTEALAVLVAPVYCTLSSCEGATPIALTLLLNEFWLPMPSGSSESRNVAPMKTFQPEALIIPEVLLKPKIKYGFDGES